MLDKQRVFNKLNAQLKREIKLFENYHKLLIQHGKTVTKFNLEKLQQLNLKRQEHSEALAKAQAERTELLDNLPNSRTKRLTEVIEAECEGEQRKELLSLAEHLKEVILKCRIKDLEFSQVASFALNTVNGSLSLMYQATQNMTRCYNPRGVEQQKYSPKRSRNETVIKQA